MRALNLSPETVERIRCGLARMRKEAVDLCVATRGHTSVQLAAEAERDALMEDLKILERCQGLTALVPEGEEAPR